MDPQIAVLDRFFSAYLDCDISKVTPGGVWVVPSDRRDRPELHYENVFALWLLASGNRCVVSVQRPLEEPVKRAVARLDLAGFRDRPGQELLRDTVASSLRSETRLVSGPVLNCTERTFRPEIDHHSRRVTARDIADLRRVGLYGDWLARSVAEGTCFAAYVDGEPVALAGTYEVPHMAGAVCDMCVSGTLPEHRREGFGRAVVAGATRAVLESGRVPVYVTSDQNMASINTARSVGYTQYGWSLMVELVG